MEQITLQIMTLPLCHTLFRGWENDPAIYDDPSLFKPYRYDPDWVDRYYAAKQRPDRIVTAIMRDGQPIGELQFKQIDRGTGTCVLSIHMQNDKVKGKGYGTQATRLALDYAFHVLGLQSVHADCIRKNTRSQHILEKTGFQWVKDEGIFRFYRIDRNEKRK